MGDVIDVLPHEGKIQKNGATVADFVLKSDVLLDEVRAGGRINLIIGRSLTAKEIVREGKVGVPASGRELVALLNKTSPKNESDPVSLRE